MTIPPIPSDLLSRSSRWPDLKRWERREIGQDLRRLGLSYGQISEIIPVGKGTLSGWCADIELSDEQVTTLRAIRPAALAMRRNGRRRHLQNLDRIGAIRDRARIEARSCCSDPLWVAGVVAYWAEGAKTSNQLQFANSDPRMISLFIEWTERYLDPVGYSARLHLHSGQSEIERIAFWSKVTGLHPTTFGKTYVKPEGTGHRKNHLYNGTLTIVVRRSTDMLHRVLGWIDGLSENQWAASVPGVAGR